MSTGGNGQPQNPGDFSYQTAFTDALAQQAGAMPPGGMPQPAPQQPVEPLPAPPPAPQQPAPAWPVQPEPAQAVPVQQPSQPFAQPLAPPAPQQPFQQPPPQQLPQDSWQRPVSPNFAVQPNQALPQPTQQVPQLPPQPASNLLPASQAPAAFGVPPQLPQQEPGALTPQQQIDALQQQIRQMQPYVHYAQQLIPHAGEIQQALQREPAQPAQQPPEEWNPSQYFADKWQTPEWTDQYSVALENGMVVQDPDTGQYVPKPGFEQMTMGLLPGLNTAILKSREQWQGLMRGNPYEQFYSVLQEPMQRAWRDDMRQVIAEEMEQREARTVVDQFEEQNAHWLYQTNPYTGQRETTQLGDQFLDEIQKLANAGMSDQRMQLDYAMRQMQMQLTQPAQPVVPQQFAPPSAQPQPPAQQAPQQQGVLPFAAPPQQALQQQQPAFNPLAASQQNQQAFLQQAMNRAGHMPSAGAYQVQQPQNVPDGSVQSESELNNMFMSAYRASQAVA